MPDLVYYLEKNSFFSRADDQEAILRRCDHDANRQISYDEFCENVCIEDAPRREAAPAEDEANNEA